jgi:hypothetical protein
VRGLAGNFLKFLIVDEFLLAGSFQLARRLVDDDSVSATLAGLRLRSMGEAMNAEECTVCTCVNTAVSQCSVRCRTEVFNAVVK